MSKTSTPAHWRVILLCAVVVIVGGIGAWKLTYFLADDAAERGNDDYATAQQANTVPTNTITNQVNSTDAEEQFTLLQPATSTTVGDITTYQFTPGNVMNVMPSSMKVTILNETPVLETTTITIGETPAQQLTISSAKDGSRIKIVQLNSDNTLYDFRGSEDFINNIDKYIKFN